MDETILPETSTRQQLNVSWWLFFKQPLRDTNTHSMRDNATSLSVLWCYTAVFSAIDRSFWQLRNCGEKPFIYFPCNIFSIIILMEFAYRIEFT